MVRGGGYRIWVGLSPGAWVCKLPINFQIFNVENYQYAWNRNLRVLRPKTSHSSIVKVLRNNIFKRKKISDFRPDLNIYVCILLLIRFRIIKTLPVLRKVMPCFDKHLLRTPSVA